MFENNGHIHLYSPGAGADNPRGQFILNIIFLLIWSFAVSLSHILNYFVTGFFFHSNAQATKFYLALEYVTVNPGSPFI